MMKKYDSPELKIVLFADVITGSTGSTDNDDGGGDLPFVPAY